MNGNIAKVVALTIIIFAAVGRSQTITSIRLKNNGTLHEYNGLTKNRLLYLPVDDIALANKLALYKNEAVKKWEIKGSEYHLKFSAGNPFLAVVTRSDSSVKTFQLPVSTFIWQNKLYIPWRYSAGYFNRYLNQNFEIKQNEILIKAQTVAKIEPSTADPKKITLKIEEKMNGTLVRFVSKNKISSFAAAKEDEKIVVTLKPAAGGWNEPGEIKSASVVDEITYANADNSDKFYIKVSDDYAAHELIRSGSNSLLLTLHKKKFGEFSREDNEKKEKWKFDAVVIDAGHGGKDYGAIGVNNTVEKDLNLAIAVKLGALIEKEMPEVKVIYTRKTDTFVELYKRGKIANENNGKLFISIHGNSVANRNSVSNGYEIYLLRPGRTAEAIAIAERENGVINYEDDPKRYKKLTDENFILVSMAHASNMKYSEKFAEFLDKHLKQNVTVTSRGVKQAGFYVLVGASMPGILFETGYVTNPQNAKYLKSREGQEDVARSLFQAVKSFKTFYARDIEEQ